MRSEIVLSANPSAPMHARVALNEAIPPPELADRFEDARLAMSEVVGNVLVHGRLEGRDTIRLTLEADDDHVRVEVEQPTPATSVRPVRPRMDGERPGGLGLRLVETMADAWGTDEGPPGVVWFEFRG